MIKASTFSRGFKSGISITWELAKIVIPVYFTVTFLKYTPFLPWLSDIMSPVMHMVGLPGETALVLVFGLFLNIYAAIGAILPLALGIKEITILSAMILIAHSLPMETAISKKTGVKVLPLLALRIILAFGMGLFFNLIL